jgi:hypothetical protein
MSLIRPQDAKSIYKNQIVFPYTSNEQSRNKTKKIVLFTITSKTTWNKCNRSSGGMVYKLSAMDAAGKLVQIERGVHVQGSGQSALSRWRVPSNRLRNSVQPMNSSTIKSQQQIFVKFTRWFYNLYGNTMNLNSQSNFQREE